MALRPTSRILGLVSTALVSSYLGCARMHRLGHRPAATQVQDAAQQVHPKVRQLRLTNLPRGGDLYRLDAGRRVLLAAAAGGPASIPLPDVSSAVLEVRAPGYIPRTLSLTPQLGELDCDLERNFVVAPASGQNAEGSPESERAFEFLLAGEARQALALYRKALSSTQDQSLWLEIGQCLERLNDGRGAAEAYRKFLATNPATSIRPLVMAMLTRIKEQP